MDTTAEVLARLTAERDRLAAELVGVEGAIAALRKAMEPSPATEVRAAAPAVPAVAPGTAPLPQTRGPFAGLDFYEAAAAYLAAAGEPKTSGEIADALVAGGYLTLASNFRASARTMLNRYVATSSAGIYRAEDGHRWCFRERNPPATS